MRNEKIVNAFNTIKPGDEVKDRVFDKIKRKQYKKRFAFKAAVSFAAAAAVICLAVFGNILPPPQSDNAFVIKAYAMEQHEDGTVGLREVDLLDQTQSLYSHYDGNVVYFSAGLRCEGENMKSVDFYTDEGFFAKQYIKMENGKVVWEGVPMAGTTDPEGRHTILMYGDDFEIIGNKFTLDKDDMADNLLLFLGMEFKAEGWRWHEQLPPQMTIRAVATFNDGKTQEETLTFQIKGRQGFGAGPVHTPEEMREITLETTDTAKLADAFISEAKELGLGEVKVTGIELDGEPDEAYQGLWHITYDVLPENGTDWVTNQSRKVSLSVHGGKYTAAILTDDEYAAIKRGEIPDRLVFDPNDPDAEMEVMEIDSDGEFKIIVEH